MADDVKVPGSEDQHDDLEKRSALSTAVIAVFLAISSIMGNNAGEAQLVNRSLANDAWSYFQSKSIKQGLYEVNEKLLDVQALDPKNDPAYAAEIKKSLAEFDDKIAKYETEKNEIMGKAKTYEDLTEKANTKADFFDFAEGFYQIAIILAAISLISKARNLWILSCIMGIIGLGYSVYAYFLP